MLDDDFLSVLKVFSCGIRSLLCFCALRMLRWIPKIMS